MAARLLDPKADFAWLSEIEQDLALVMEPRSKFDRVVLAERLVEAGLTLVSEAETFAKHPFRRAIGIIPSEPQSYGRRFVSPAGDAWLWFFAVPANREAAVNANADQFPPPPAERRRRTSCASAVPA